MLNDTVVSLIRTWVPVVLGSVLAFLANKGFEIEINQSVVVALVISVYYALARLLEKVHPLFGWLLGVPSQPAYQGTPPAGPAPSELDG